MIDLVGAVLGPLVAVGYILAFRKLLRRRAKPPVEEPYEQELREAEAAHQQELREWDIKFFEATGKTADGGRMIKGSFNELLAPGFRNHTSPSALEQAAAMQNMPFPDSLRIALANQQQALGQQGALGQQMQDPHGFLQQLLGNSNPQGKQH